MLVSSLGRPSVSAIEFLSQLDLRLDAAGSIELKRKKKAFLFIRTGECQSLYTATGGGGGVCVLPWTPPQPLRRCGDTTKFLLFVTNSLVIRYLPPSGRREQDLWVLVIDVTQSTAGKSG